MLEQEKNNIKNILKSYKKIKNTSVQQLILDIEKYLNDDSYDFKKIEHTLYMDSMRKMAESEFGG